MPEPVKPTRRYDSTQRRQQAADTRRVILDAAGRLFAEQGYAATTMAMVAREAGVALKTVYLAFETKSGLLRELWHLLLRGDEGTAPVGERQWYQEVLDEPDPVRQLELNARNSRAVKERAATLMTVGRPGDAGPGAPYRRPGEGRRLGGGVLRPRQPRAHDQAAGSQGGGHRR